MVLHKSIIVIVCVLSFATGVIMKGNAEMLKERAVNEFIMKQPLSVLTDLKVRGI